MGGGVEREASAAAEGESPRAVFHNHAIRELVDVAVIIPRKGYALRLTGEDGESGEQVVSHPQIVYREVEPAPVWGIGSEGNIMPRTGVGGEICDKLSPVVVFGLQGIYGHEGGQLAGELHHAHHHAAAIVAAELHSQGHLQPLQVVHVGQCRCSVVAITLAHPHAVAVIIAALGVPVLHLGPEPMGRPARLEILAVGQRLALAGQRAGREALGGTVVGSADGCQREPVDR